MEAQLRACVQQSLDDFMYSNAKFMCERLYAEFANEANLLLLATTYLRSDQAYRAYHLLKDAQWTQQRRLSQRGRFLLAQSCFQLAKYEEARAALKADSHGQIPGGAAGFHLLGQIHSLTDSPKYATEAFHSALSQDPLMWSAYERLCQLGHNESAEEVLNQAVLENSPQEMQSWPLSVNTNVQSHDFFRRSGNRLSFSSNTPANPSLRQSYPGPSSSQEQFHYSNGTPNLTQNNQFITPSPGVLGAQVAPAPKRNGHIGIRETPTPTPLQRGMGRKVNYDDNPYKFFDDGKLRKVSNRLFAEPSAAISNSPNITTRRGSRLASSSNTPLQPPPNVPQHYGIPKIQFAQLREDIEQPKISESSERGESSAEGQRETMNLLRPIGKAYGLLCMYKCQEAITAFDELSVKQYKTGWVYSQIGRAYYEMVDFKASANAFQQARKCDPTRLEGMEVYSTVLWHLKREVELSHLAQEAIMLDRLDPRSWCIMGNCFSLQKDQNAALKFFQRAVQLDPSFVYAYTLAGHENLALEQFDKSIACYRNAMKLDPRHYHAWYGCGQIFYRQEKYEVAAYHFEASLKINDRSSILLCYMGKALAKLNRHGEAVSMLQNAIRADTQNPLARFELANVLVDAGYLSEALQELEQLKDKAPKEASIYFHMGQIYHRLNRPDLALVQFSQALDLRPSSADVNMIKAAIEKLRISNEFDNGL